MSRRAIALLLSPLGLVLISAGRLLIISDYNTTTATAVASSTGYFNTLLGTLLPLVPAFIPYLALLLLLLRQFVLSIVAFAVTAFIAPTPLAHAATRRLVISDTQQLLFHSLGNWPFDLLLTALVGLVIGVAVWQSLHSFAEALAALVVLAIVVFLLFTPLAANLARLRPASTSDHQVINQIYIGHPTRAIAILLVICILLILPYASSLSGLITVVVAVVTALALFPYVTNFYPAPGGGNYYVNALRTPWLSPEKVTVSSGRAYYGYVLEETPGWFTVLRSKNRKIVYIPAKQVIHRSPCEPAAQAQGDHISRPIAGTFYQPSPHMKVCADSKYLKHSQKRHKPGKAAHRHHGEPGRTRSPGGRLSPTPAPTVTPTFAPTLVPTFVPTVVPTFVPTVVPTPVPSVGHG